MLKYYFDWICQPSRALYILMKLNNVPFEPIVVSLRNNEHEENSFKEINRFQKLPCIVDEGFHLAESVAILRYLSNKGFIADNFFPSNPKDRARVEEYLEWQANNLRLGGAMFVKTQWIIPRLLKQPPPEDGLYRYLMEESLNILENIWLGEGEKEFLIFDKISFADILACCDLEQIRVTDYDPFENRPKLERMWRAVKKIPFYDEAHQICYKMGKNKERFSN